ncbi:MAG: DUF5312 domain-containing protein [Treponema sp.]|jgi:hypothetical protein|nr:DUF5312 domain-containing protein [Treponema sp.]
MGFLDNIVAIFSGANDPEANKKKRIRQVTKVLSQNKYSRFYRIKSEELDAALAKFFYDVYKIISPAQVFLRNAAKSDQLKVICIESFLDKELKALNERLRPASIEERAKKGQVTELAGAIKKELSAFQAGFDNTRIANIDACYNTIISFVRFIDFDYFFLLKKFDANINERNFNYQPRFQPVRGTELVEELKDFMELSASVGAEQDWKAPLAVLKLYKEGMDVVNPDQWEKVIRFLRDVGRSRILELIVQHISKDPLFQSVSVPPDERVADSFLDAKRAEIEGAVNKMQNDKRSAQIDQLAKGIFGSADVERMEYYTVKNNEIFLKKNFDGFTKIAGVNYLKAFLLDFFKKEIRELCDLFLIRGQWTSSVLSQQMSNSFHEIMGLSEKILVFDAALSDKGEHGSRLKQSLAKVDRDKGQGKYIRIILRTVNNDAQRMINTAAQNLIIIGRNLKTLLEDYQKKPAELIMNWKELESVSESPIVSRVTETYKRIYYFVQLLQFYSGPVEEDP